LAEQTQGVAEAPLILRRFGNLLGAQKGLNDRLGILATGKEVIDDTHLPIQQQQLEALLLCGFTRFDKL
jgi:hypothetical protein